MEAWPPPRELAGEGTRPPTTGNPIVIVLIGVNGSGKTTTAAKLAWKLKQEGRSVTLAACDTFRAAAVEQLKAWSTKLELETIASHPGADAAAVAAPSRGQVGPAAQVRRAKMAAVVAATAPAMNR